MYPKGKVWEDAHSKAKSSVNDFYKELRNVEEVVQLQITGGRNNKGGEEITVFLRYISYIIPQE